MLEEYNILRHRVVHDAASRLRCIQYPAVDSFAGRKPDIRYVLRRDHKLCRVRLFYFADGVFVPARVLLVVYGVFLSVHTQDRDRRRVPHTANGRVDSRRACAYNRYTAQLRDSILRRRTRAFDYRHEHSIRNAMLRIFAVYTIRLDQDGRTAQRARYDAIPVARKRTAVQAVAEQYRAHQPKMPRSAASDTFDRRAKGLAGRGGKRDRERNIRLRCGSAHR